MTTGLKPAVLPCLLAGVLLAGCGGGGNSGSANTDTSSSATTGTTSNSTDAVRAAHVAFLNAFKERQFGDACEMLTTAAQREIAFYVNGKKAVSGSPEEACPASLMLSRSLIGSRKLDAEIALVKRAPVSIHGSVAVTKDPDGNRTYVVYRDGRWLLADKHGH